MLDAWRKRLGAWSREIDLDSGIPGGSGTLESQRPRLRLCSYCDAAITIWYETACWTVRHQRRAWRSENRIFLKKNNVFIWFWSKLTSTYQQAWNYHLNFYHSSAIKTFPFSIQCWQRFHFKTFISLRWLKIFINWHQLHQYFHFSIKIIYLIILWLQNYKHMAFGHGDTTVLYNIYIQWSTSDLRYIT